MLVKLQYLLLLKMKVITGICIENISQRIPDERIFCQDTEISKALLIIPRLFESCNLRMDQMRFNVFGEIGGKNNSKPDTY